MTKNILIEKIIELKKKNNFKNIRHIETSRTCLKDSKELNLVICKEIKYLEYEHNK